MGAIRIKKEEYEREAESGCRWIAYHTFLLNKNSSTYKNAPHTVDLAENVEIFNSAKIVPKTHWIIALVHSCVLKSGTH